MAGLATPASGSYLATRMALGPDGTPFAVFGPQGTGPLTVSWIGWPACGSRLGRTAWPRARQWPARQRSTVRHAALNSCWPHCWTPLPLAQVRKWSGGAWATVGTAGAISGAWQSIAVDASGAPLVAFMDTSVSNRASVVRWDGSAWQPLGSRGISAGAGVWTAITVHRASGAVFAAYVDGGLGWSIRAKQYKSGAWSDVEGSTQVSVSDGNGCQITTNAAGRPYVAFTDLNAGALRSWIWRVVLPAQHGAPQ